MAVMIECPCFLFDPADHDYSDEPKIVCECGHQQDEHNGDSEKCQAQIESDLTPITFRETELVVVGEWAIQWPPDSDFEGDGWFIDHREWMVRDQFEHAPVGAVLYVRACTEWQVEGVPRRAWQMSAGKWQPMEVK